MRKAITQRRTNCRACCFRETGLRNDLNSGSASCMISTGGSFLSVWRMVPFITTILPKFAERRKPPFVSPHTSKKAQLQKSQVTLQNLEGSEQATGQCVVLDVANSPFDLPLGSSATGTTGFGCQPTVTAKGLESWIPDHLAGLAIVGGHQWRGVVTEDLLGEAPKML